MSEQLGRALLHLATDDRELDRGINSARGKAEGLARDFDRFGQRARALGGRLSLAVTAPIGAMAVSSVNAAREQAKAVASVDAALASMGNTAGYTSADLQRMASDLQANSLFGDEQILSKVTANLLTFGNVSGESFSRAQQAALDLSARLGTDLQSSTVMLGKALNDPIAGLTAMTRVGVSFTEQQKDQIKAMAEAGDMAGAQALILSELERQYGGQAKAMAEADGGITQLANSWGDFREQIGAVIMEILPPLISGLSGLVGWLQGLDDGTRKWVVGIALAAAAAGPLLVVIGMMASGISSLILAGPLLASAFGMIATAITLVGKAAMLLLANPVFLAIAAAVAAVWLAWENWDRIKPLIDSVGAAITGWWNENVKPILDLVMQKLGAVADFFRDYFGAQIKGAVSVIAALLNGDFKGAWEAAQATVSRMVAAVLGLLGKLVPGATEAMKGLYLGVKQWVQDKLGAVFDWLKKKVEMVEGAFAWLYDRVVGNSWIPDLVRDVGKSMAGLDDAMVKPALAAAQAVDEIFAGLSAPDAAGLGMPFPDETGREMGDKVGRFFSDGIRSALDGDLGGFLRGWLKRLGDSLIDSLANGLGTTISSLLGGAQGSGVFSALGSIFAGFFATGGMIPAGQFGIVGERGPEPVIGTRRGAMVLPNSSLRSMAAPGGGVQVSVPIAIDATGADPAALARVRDSVERLRAELPGRIVSTVQDAGGRGMLSTRDWR